MITNGILLTDEVRRALVSLGLHRLWVSLDGATPAAYRDVRIGDALPEILENLAAFRRLRDESPVLGPRLGIVFVAMRRNVAELPAVVRLGRDLGMDQLLVTNVLAYTADLKDEVLYDEGLAPGDGDSPERPAILLPRLETSEPVRRALATVIEEGPADVRPRLSVARGRNFCPFVERGTTSVRWDGTVSPCLALLYEHDYYLGERLRHSYPHGVGNVRDRSLAGPLERRLVRRAATAAPGLRLLPVQLLQHLRARGRQPAGLLGLASPRLRRLPLGAGADPVPVASRRALVPRARLRPRRRRSGSRTANRGSAAR